MIILKNRKVNIFRHVEIDEKNIYSQIKTWLDVFIYPLTEDVNLWDTWIASYEWYKIMSDDLDIKIWDKIEDDLWKKYIVKGAKIYQNVIETHLEWILILDYN